ncbi:hypothetical protein BC827DRAFT_1372614 [Russula dissimulans]|nr:hypothetical protein BC827DRAFT_1372614 [Russula dissimulans]
MSSNNQTADSNFTAIFEEASNQYKSLTGQDLGTHPFAVALNSYNSTESILNVFREQAQAFDKIRKRGDKLMAWLTPIVHILYTFSETLGEAISLPFSPAKTIFAGIGILLGAVKDVIASYETLVYTFERIQFFLQRLNHYTAIRLTPEMTELLGKIMAQVLSILAFSTKALKERRIKTVLKRLVGKTDVKDALVRLDTLTKEENLMIVARTLEVIHNVDDNATTIKEAVHNVDSNVKATKELTHQVDQNILEIKEVVSDVGGNAKATKELMYDIHKNVAVTEELVHDVRSDVGVIKGETHGVGQDVKVIKRAIDIQQRNQLRDKLRTWLAPPNPSINHSTACDIQHDGTANWFIRGDTFGEWKQNGSLLWIRGNPGSGKSILCSAIIEDIKNMRESGSALVAYYYFDFKEVAKRHVRGLLTSLLMQLCDGSDSCWDIFSEFYTRCGNGQEYPGDAALAQCLKAMLDRPGQVPVYIIIDALDECPNNIGTPSAREKVLSFVEDLVLSHRSNLFMCITSRPEQDIQSVLSPLISTPRRVSLHDEGGQREDINSYIRYFVQNDRAMRRWRAEDKDLVIAILSERANGMWDNPLNIPPRDGR